MLQQRGPAPALLPCPWFKVPLMLRIGQQRRPVAHLSGAPALFEMLADEVPQLRVAAIVAVYGTVPSAFGTAKTDVAPRRMRSYCDGVIACTPLRRVRITIEPPATALDIQGSNWGVMANPGTRFDAASRRKAERAAPGLSL